MGALLAAISYQPVQRWSLGPFGVSPHGVGTAAGYLAGVIVMTRAAERRGIPRAEVHNAATWGAVGAIIGARGFYVLAHLSDFPSIADVLAVWRGGLTMFGGFAVGLAFAFVYFRRHAIDIARAMDAAAPGFVIAVMIGRIGDLIIADHLGRATGFVLGYKIPRGANLAPGFGPPTYVPGAVVHQTALYDFVGLAVLGGVVALLARRTPRPGTLYAAFATWYGLQRFVIDFTRNRDLIESNFFGLSGSQWAGILFAAIGIGALVRIHTAAAAAVAQPEAPAIEGEAPVPAPVIAPPPAVLDLDEIERARWEDEAPGPTPPPTAP
jgi:phosphatidylglycerol:prolipoprotein diacylglycerol transferase